MGGFVWVGERVGCQATRRRCGSMISSGWVLIMNIRITNMSCLMTVVHRVSRVVYCALYRRRLTRYRYTQRADETNGINAGATLWPHAMLSVLAQSGFVVVADSVAHFVHDILHIANGVCRRCLLHALMLSQSVAVPGVIPDTGIRKRQSCMLCISFALLVAACDLNQACFAAPLVATGAVCSAAGSTCFSTLLLHMKHALTLA